MRMRSTRTQRRRHGEFLRVCSQDQLLGHRHRPTGDVSLWRGGRPTHLALPPVIRRRLSPVAASLSRPSTSAAFLPKQARAWQTIRSTQLNTTLDSDRQPPNIDPLDYRYFNPSAAEPC